MHADSVFVIGGSHRVCQDYALHYADARTTCAVVSDGCSGSADTDIGARLMALQTLRFACQYGAPGCADDGQTIVAQAGVCAELLGLPGTVLDATVLALVCQNNVLDGQLRVFCAGDGMAAALFGPQALEVWDIEVPSGYPLYLSYLLRKSKKRYASVLEKGASWAVYRETPTRTKYEDYVGADVFTYRYGTVDYSGSPQVVAVFSDGVKSFRDAQGNEVPASQIVHELMTFKGYKGEFVKRRMQGFLKDVKRRGWTYADDLSMAAIYVESED